MAEMGASTTRSMHVPAQAHRALRKLQLRIEEEAEETISLGELAGAVILLGTELPLQEIVAQARQLAQQPPTDVSPPEA